MEEKSRQPCSGSSWVPLASCPEPLCRQPHECLANRTCSAISTLPEAASCLSGLVGIVLILDSLGSVIRVLSLDSRFYSHAFNPRPLPVLSASQMQGL